VRADAPEIEVLWCEGCPSTDRALGDLRAALGELGLGPTEVRLIDLTHDHQALSRGFAGSPTILIDGRDVAPLAGAGATAGEAAHRAGDELPSVSPP
jgi:hypothetical protein